MKTYPILFLILLCTIGITQAQQTDPEKLQIAVDSKTFIFEARQATGTRGNMIQLDLGSILDVKPKKVLGDLPFFGRSYQATLGGADGGLNFDFSEYDYSVKPRKKGGWDITIKPTESNDIRAIFLTIQKTGNASLRITSNSKEGMSYSGIIKE